ncbi:hypothetical protein AAVH_34051 [Aphelenchoides avenae]|nr:hypothetical protein AAVH_34051 [Aphelenchus avenae]
MRYRMMTDKPLVDFPDSDLDAAVWNQDLKELREKEGVENVTWYKAPWLFTECYLYRKIAQFYAETIHLRRYDPFRAEKERSYFDSMAHMVAIGTEIAEHEDKTLSEAEIRTILLRLLQVALWGNKCDLSLSGGDPHVISSMMFKELDELRPNVLADDLEAACDKHLLRLHTPQEVGLVLDNAGLEIFVDLCLADFLISQNLASKVVFHGKAFPWFVSDTTHDDLEWVLARLGENDDANLKRLGARWTERFQKGQFVFKAHPFWTFGYAYAEMQNRAPDLYQELSASAFLVFKGDLNYRKLVGDREWPSETEFKKALCGFEPTSFIALRTLKAETVAGLSREAVSSMKKKFGDDQTWMVSSEFAVAQLFSK